MVYTFDMGRLYHILGIGIIGTAALVMLIFIINKSDMYIEMYSNFANVFTTGTTNTDPASSTANTSAEVPKNTKILILGDMMFDRTVRSKINTYGFEYVFGPATTTFANYDLVVANLEGPISTNKSKTILDNNKSISGFQFTFATGTARALKNAGIDVVSLANNHTDNFGQDGLNQTRKFLDDAGVQYFGSPQNNTAIATSTCIAMSATGISKDSDSKLCIGFIGWHEFGSKNHQNILNEITLLRPKVDYLVVFPHWGEEYKKTPHIEQVRLARVWTDTGADAVIGAHPHVIQQITRRTTADGRVVPIFYSLGNFIFDQYFSFDTTHGIAVEIEFEATSTAVTESASISTSTQSMAQSAKYKIIPFSSVGTKVSIPNATSTARIFGDIEKVSGTSTWGWLNK